MMLAIIRTHRAEVIMALNGRLSKSLPSTHKERLEMKSHLTGQLSAPFVICEYFHFWHLVKLAEANQAKDFPTTRRLVPTHAQCSVPSIISKSNSGVNPKERSNFRRLCLGESLREARSGCGWGHRHWWQHSQNLTPPRVHRCEHTPPRNSLICTFPILTFN